MRPARTRSARALPLVLVASLAAVLGAHLVAGLGWRASPAVYLASLSVGAFLLFGVDKARARTGARRIPEADLLGVALLGGGVGAWFGMRAFRHKTRHGRFRVLVPLAALLQVALLVAAIAA